MDGSGGKDLGDYMQYYSQKRERFYYVHKSTKQTSWELPQTHVIGGGSSALAAQLGDDSTGLSSTYSHEQTALESSPSKRARTSIHQESQPDSAEAGNSSKSASARNSSTHNNINSNSNSGNSNSSSSSSAIRSVTLTPVRISDIPEPSGAHGTSPWRRIDLAESLSLPGSPNALAEAYKGSKASDENGVVGKFRNVISPLEGRVIYNLIVDNRYSRTLEIGMGCGATSVWICSAFKQSQSLGYHHQAVDVRQSSDYKNTGVTLLKKCSLDKYYSLEQNHSYLVLPRMITELTSRSMSKFHLIVLDSDHTFDSIMADFRYVDLLLEEHGVLVIPNVAHKAIEKFVKYVQKNCSTQYRLLENPAFSIKDPSRRFLVVFTKLPALHATFRTANSFTEF